ncbi:MAG: ketopantoate reductase family protein [Gemmatimonadetes bacterium]|nr:ketopantoate reductase family protein [Gemmatimonadota bacterium]MDA1102272.1 ketopantoate reductase family protein [Gemmatimonadota bacterium]
MHHRRVRVAIVGAGGLGSYIGAVLARVGHEVTLIARGAHAASIEEHGLRVLSHAGDFSVRPKCAGSAFGLDGIELTFVAVKTYSLDAVAPQVRHLSEGGSVVVSLLNGVTATARLIAQGCGADRTLDGVAYMTAFRIEAGVVQRKAEHQEIVVGSPTARDAGAAGVGGDAAAYVERAFRETSVKIGVAADIRVELWEKMAVVCSLSVLCAMAARNMGSVRAHPLGADLQRQAIGEVLAVGRARGVPIPSDAEARIDEKLDLFPDDFFPSVIHDLNSGFRTEMDDLGGAISQMGREVGVPTPLHDAGTCIVQVAEARA